MKNKRGPLYVGLVLVGLGLVGRFILVPYAQVEPVSDRRDPMDGIIHEMMHSQDLPKVAQRQEMVKRFKKNQAPAESYDSFKSFREDNKAGSDEFKKLLKDAFDSIPTITDVHSVGVVLGDIRMVMNERSDLFNLGISFYEKCAQSSSLSDSVRSLCLASLMEYGVHSDGPGLYESYPRSVIELARRAISWP